jgi:hypothetical protein
MTVSRVIPKDVRMEAHRRVSAVLRCLAVLVPAATPRQTKRLANRILVMCREKGRVHTMSKREPRRLTPELLDDLFRIHASCVHDQEGKCGLLISISSLTWEINQACGLADDTDKGFKRHDPMCAARPLRMPFVEDGRRLVDSMFEEDTDGEDQG